MAVANDNEFIILVKFNTILSNKTEILNDIIKQFLCILVFYFADLHHAVKHGNTSKVRELIVTTKNINQLYEHKDRWGWETNISLLQLAAENGFTDIVQLLLSNNARIDLQNKYGDTALIGP